MKYLILKKEEQELIYPLLENEIRIQMEIDPNVFAVVAADEDDEVLGFVIVNIDEVSSILYANTLDDLENLDLLDQLVYKTCLFAKEAGSKIMTAVDFDSDMDVDFVMALEENQFLLEKEIIEKSFYIDGLDNSPIIKKYAEDNEAIVHLKDVNTKELLAYDKLLKETEGYTNLLNPIMDGDLSLLYRNPDESIGGALLLSRGESELRVEYWTTGSASKDQNRVGMRLIATAIEEVNKAKITGVPVYVQLINKDVEKALDLLGLSYFNESNIKHYFKVLEG